METNGPRHRPLPCLWGVAVQRLMHRPAPPHTLMVHGMWTFKVQGVGEFLLTLTSDGRLTHAHRGPGPWDLSWGPPQDCDPALDWISPDAGFQRLRAERDRARDIAVALEQEIDQCTEGYFFHQSMQGITLHHKK